MYSNNCNTRAPLQPPASLAQGRMQLIHVKGVERGGPRFGATSELIMPTAVCACLVALLLWCALSVLCACWGYHVLIDSTGVVCGGGGYGDREDDQLKKAIIPVHNAYIPVPGTSIHTWYCCCMFERKHSVARHSTAPQARHATARHCAAPRC